VVIPLGLQWFDYAECAAPYLASFPRYRSAARTLRPLRAKLRGCPELVAIITEVNEESVKYGDGIESVSSFMSQHGFTAVTYDPWQRDITVKHKRLDDTLYVRDLEKVSGAEASHTAFLGAPSNFKGYCHSARRQFLSLHRQLQRHAVGDPGRAPLDRDRVHTLAATARALSGSGASAIDR
jgi:hypothetical protein